nr:hypothetical protein [Tanacetum cinerariifolium]
MEVSLWSELASPEIKCSSDDADEDIGVDEVSSAIYYVFHIGESNEVHSEFGELTENKKSVVEVVMGGGEALRVYREKSRGVTEGERRVLCYVQGSKRLKKKKIEAQRRLWDPRIKSAFLRQYLEGKVILKEWGMIRLWICTGTSDQLAEVTDVEESEEVEED